MNSSTNHKVVKVIANVEEGLLSLDDADAIIDYAKESFRKLTEQVGIASCRYGAYGNCAGEESYDQDDRWRYCLLHYPGQDKAAAFSAALQKKLEAQDFNFGRVWFPEAVNFSGVQFSADACFHETIFSEDVDFGSATFSADADFGSARFDGQANFRNAIFSKSVNFRLARFKKPAIFRNAIFASDADFRYAFFCGRVYFNHATFAAYASFKGFAENEGKSTWRLGFGEHAYLSMDSARIEKPERVSFHSLMLRPHWFINTDVRKFEFVNIIERGINS